MAVLQNANVNAAVPSAQYYGNTGEGSERNDVWNH